MHDVNSIPPVSSLPLLPPATHGQGAVQPLVWATASSQQLFPHQQLRRSSFFCLLGFSNLFRYEAKSLPLVLRPCSSRGFRWKRRCSTVCTWTWTWRGVLVHSLWRASRTGGRQELSRRLLWGELPLRGAARLREGGACFWGSCRCAGLLAQLKEGEGSFWGSCRCAGLPD